MKLYEGGKLVQVLPLASQRIMKLAERLRRNVVMNAIAVNLGWTEAYMRERIEKLPDCEYAYEDCLELFDAGRFDPKPIKAQPGPIVDVPGG